MYPLKQSTALDVLFFAHDANGDGVTGIVDGSFTKRISKNGGTFAAMTVTVTERENGFYHAQVSTAHSDTLGVLTISLSASGIKRVNLQWKVQARVDDDLLPTATYVAPPTAVQNRQEMDTNSTQLAKLGTFTNHGGGATVAGNLNDIEGMVDDIGVAGAGLTNLGDTRLANLNATVSSRAVAGDAMTLTSGERTSVATAVWASASRTLTSFGTLTTDVATAVWAAGTRTLTGFGTLVADIWNNATRTLTAFGFTVNTAVNAAETAIQVVTDKLNTALELDGAVYRYTTNALEQAPAGGGGGSTQQQIRDAMLLAPTPPGTAASGSVDDKLNDILALGGGGGGGGSGAFVITALVTNGTTPLMNALVQVNNGTDSFTLMTDSAGEAVFSLDAGTYTVSATRAGHQHTPELRTVIGNEVGTLTNPIVMTVIPPPGPPSDASMCRVYGYLETIGNQPAAEVTVVFTLMAPNPEASGDWLIAGRRLWATTDESGTLMDIDGNPFIDLVRNDQLLPTGTQYSVSCQALMVTDKLITLNTPTLDLKTIIT